MLGDLGIRVRFVAQGQIRSLAHDLEESFRDIFLDIRFSGQRKRMVYGGTPVCRRIVVQTGNKFGPGLVHFADEITIPIRLYEGSVGLRGTDDAQSV